MRRSMLLLSLIGALAVLGVSAGAAQAQPPEFGQCVKVSPKGSGEYKDKNCQDNLGKGGAYDWIPIVKPFIFNDEDRGATFRYYVGFPPFRFVVVVTCKKSESYTDYISRYDVITHIVYVECSLRIEHILYPCTTPGSAQGTIETQSLAGTLGYTNEADTEVGIDFANAELGSAGALTTIECDGLRTVISGSVIAKVTGDVNKMSAKNDQTYAETEGVQTPDQLEGGPLDTPLADSTFGEEHGEAAATIAAVEKESGKEKIEIKL